MEQWSILSNIVNYIQYDRHSKNFYGLNIKTIDHKEEDRQILELDFGEPP